MKNEMERLRCQVEDLKAEVLRLQQQRKASPKSSLSSRQKDTPARSRTARSQSEEKFQLVFQTSPDSININRLSDGLYIDVNEGFTKLTGYTREDAIGKSSIDLKIWDNSHDMKRLVNGLMTDGYVENIEARFRRKNGQVGIGLMSARVLKLNQEDTILSITRDITERQQAEVTLRESEERHRQIVESSTDAILMRSGGFIIYANPSAVKLFRASHAGELLGKPYLDLVHPDDRPESIERIRKGMDEKWIAPPREHRILTLDGQVVLVESTGVPVQYQGQTQIFGVIRDITERKRTEEELRENLLFLRQTEKIGRICGWKANIKTDELKWTEGVYHILEAPLGYKPGLEEGLKFYDTESIPVIKNALTRALEDGSPFVIQAKVITTTGKRLWAEVRGLQQVVEGEKTSVVGTFQDITERKQVEEHLRETEKKYRELAESLPQVIFEVDLDGTLKYVNQTVYQLFGYTPEEIARGFNVLEAFIPEDRERVALDIMLNIQGQGLGRREYTAVRKDGTRFPAGVHANRILRGQTATGVRGILIDLTKTKRAEEEKKKLEIQLQQAQKMEAIGALAGGIAHDFNNILSAIIGYTELARLNGGVSTIENELNQVLIAANRAKDLVKQILAFSRQTDEERMPVSVGMVVKEAIKFLRATIPTTIEIKSRIDKNSGAVLANSVELHQIIMNLCTNAVHAIGDRGGVLEVEVRNAEIEHAQINNFVELEMGSYVLVSVKDTGYGMTPDVIKRIFDPYFTTKEKGVGTGLGLAVVHGIVKKSGGAIQVESEPGKWTIFYIYLPRINMTLPIKAAQRKPIEGGPERILFVDDEKMLVDIGEQALQRLGYHVVSRTSSIEALELFKAKPDYFDLVITDQTMPGMTGDALARELLRIRPNLPVIICTGYSQTIDHERAKKIGIKALVEKPMLMDEIAAAVRKVLNKDPNSSQVGR
jgi:PAS domain S-box-containing protein